MNESSAHSSINMGDEIDESTPLLNEETENHSKEFNKLHNNLEDLCREVESGAINLLKDSTSFQKMERTQKLSQIIDLPESNGKNLLHIAAEKLNCNIMEELLRKNANPNARDDKGNSALNILAYQSINNPEQVSQVRECLETLLKDDVNTDLDSINHDGKYPLGLLLEGTDANVEKNQDLYNRLIEEKQRRNLHLTEGEAKKLKVNYDNRKHNVLPGKIYNCIVTKKIDMEIKQLLEDKDSDEFKRDVNKLMNGFIGSKRLLCHIIDEYDDPSQVTLLLNTFQFDPFVKNLNGDMPLHRAFVRKDNCIIKKIVTLIQKYESTDKISPYLTNIVHSLINNSLLVSTIRYPKEYTNMLRQLMNCGVNIDLNEALKVAEKAKNQNAIAILIAHGASIYQKPVSITKTTLNSAFDECIVANGSEADNLEHPDHTVKLNYKFLFANHNKEKESSVTDDIFIMNFLLTNSHLKETLKHPLIQVYLFAKWQQLAKMYLIDLLIDGLMILSMLLIHILDLDKRSFNIVWILSMYTVLKEVGQIIIVHKRYFLEIQNYFEIFTICSIFSLNFINMPDEAFHHLSAWTMLTLAYMFVLSLSRIPRFTLYITFMRRIMRNFLKVLLPLSTMFIAFSYSFTVIYETRFESQNNLKVNNGSLWKAFPLTLVKSTGEFEYSTYSSKMYDTNAFYYISSTIIFMSFIFVIYLVVTNVLTGIAVSDLKDMKEEILLKSVIHRLIDVTIIHKFFSDKRSETSLISKPIQWLKVYATDNQMVKLKDCALVVYINRVNWKKISYKHRDDKDLETRECYLDVETSSALKSYYMNTIQSKKEESVEEMLKDLRTDMNKVLHKINCQETKRNETGTSNEDIMRMLKEMNSKD